MNIVAAAPPLSFTPNRKISATVEQNPQVEQDSAQQLQIIKQLKARNSVVHAHELAHLSAGNGITRGGATFSYQRGPDGVQYAVGGEVQIDTSIVAGNPQATLEKALKIQAAALAPLQPSSQDRSVAANAVQMAIEARAEILKQSNENSSSENNSSNNNAIGAFIDFKV